MMWKTSSLMTYSRRILRLLTLAALVLLPISVARGQDSEAAARSAEEAGRLQEALDHYLTALRALPDPPPLEADIRLRERIIKLVSKLNPPPEMPEEAERHAARATVMFRMAKEPSDYRGATAELRKAVRLAPWVPPLAFNLALAEEKLGRIDAAIANLTLYLLSEPPDARDQRTKLYELEYMKERSEERAAAAVPAKLWVYATIPSGAETEIYINGIETVRIDNRRYFLYRAKPAPGHTIKAGKELAISLDAAPGGEYYVRLKNIAGRWTSFSVEWALELMQKEEALSEMRKMKPSDSEDVIDSRFVSLARIE